LLDLSKLEAGKMQFNMRPANICEVVERAANSFQELMKGRNIHLQQECDTALREQTITMDADRIEQVIANLISNAIKFSPDNGVIRIRVQRHSEGPQPMLAFEISDEGPGVPAGEEEKIFDKFIQSSRTKTGAGGTGLGLSICRQIIEAHRGKIWYTHPAGELGRFCFSLPILTDS
jgi:signal transduction histidine kinase